jgi:hypothetical protein
LEGAVSWMKIQFLLVIATPIGVVYHPSRQSTRRID